MYVFSILFYVTVPGLASILIEKFPEYVQDMMQKKDNNIKAEFMVGFVYVCVCFTCLNLLALSIIYTVGSGKATSAALKSSSFTLQQGSQQIQKYLSM